jgi:hypothetical protein
MSAGGTLLLAQFVDGTALQSGSSRVRFPMLSLVLTKSFWPHCGSRFDSVSNTNEYQEYYLGGKGGRCIRLTTISLSCSDCPEICGEVGASTSRNPQDLFRLVEGLLYFNLYLYHIAHV